MRRSLSIALGSLLATAAFASGDEIPVSDGGTVQITLSSRELTRIAMTDGVKLGRILAPDGSLDVKPGADAEGKDTGDAFIKPLESSSGKVISFFLRDDRGSTYTIIAKVADVPSHTVLLRPTDSKPIANSRASLEKAEPFVRRMKALVRAMETGDPKGDFQHQRVGQVVPIWKQVSAVFDERWSAGTDLIGEAWTFSNATAGELHLDEMQFTGLYPDIRAVAIEHQTLPTNTSTRVIILRGIPGATS